MLLKVLDKEFEIKGKLVNSGVSFPNSKSDTLHNQFRITIKRIVESGKVGVSFNCYDSQKNYEEGKEELTDEDLKNAFGCLISDSEIGSGSFEDFCSELGYSEDSKNDVRVYLACVKQNRKTLKLGIMNSELNDIREELEKE